MKASRRAARKLQRESSNIVQAIVQAKIAQMLHVASLSHH